MRHKLLEISGGPLFSRCVSEAHQGSDSVFHSLIGALQKGREFHAALVFSSLHSLFLTYISTFALGIGRLKFMW